MDKQMEANFVEIDGMIIGFGNAKSTGDMSARESGWEFDTSTIFEMEEICHVHRRTGSL